MQNLGNWWEGGGGGVKFVGVQDRASKLYPESPFVRPGILMVF